MALSPKQKNRLEYILIGILAYYNIYGILNTVGGFQAFIDYRILNFSEYEIVPGFRYLITAGLTISVTYSLILMVAKRKFRINRALKAAMYWFVLVQLVQWLSSLIHWQTIYGEYYSYFNEWPEEYGSDTIPIWSQLFTYFNLFGKDVLMVLSFTYGITHVPVSAATKHTRVNLGSRFLNRLIDAGILLLLIYQFDLEEIPPVLLGLPFIYYFTFEYFFRQTIGKLHNDAVIHHIEEGWTPMQSRFRNAVLRTLCRFIPFDALSFLFARNHVGWHDRFSKTRVIRQRKEFPDTLLKHD